MVEPITRPIADVAVPPLGYARFDRQRARTKGGKTIDGNLPLGRQTIPSWAWIQGAFGCPLSETFLRLDDEIHFEPVQQG